MAKASIKFYPNAEKKSRKSGKIPLYMRIMNNNKKAECRLPIEVPESELKNWNIILQRFEHNKLDLNRFLNKYEKQFEDIKYIYSSKIQTLSATVILQEIIGIKNKYDCTIAGYCTARYNKFILNDSEKSEGTKKNYNKALNHLVNYLIYKNQRTLTFNEIDKHFPDNIKEYLMTPIPSIKKKKMSEVSASGNIKKIKTFFTNAIKDGLIEKNPFDGFKLKIKSPKKEKLTTMQLKKLFQVNWGINSRLDKVADIFLFSVFTGLSYSDAMGLMKTELQRPNEENVYIQISRNKTGEYTRQFFTSQAIRIIEKYKNDPAVVNSKFVLPQISNQDYNRWLKIIALKIEVPFNLTSHSARHGFRVMLNEARITDSSVRKTMLGHSLNSDIDGTYNEVREEQLFEAKELYQNFLNSLFETK